MKQFEFLILSIESIDNLQENLNIIGNQGWHLGGISDWRNVLFLQRELESKHEVTNTPCESVLNEVREILKTKENFSVVQRAKEVMAIINNNEENNDKLNQYVAIEGETDSGEFRNLGLHHGLNTQTKK